MSHLTEVRQMPGCSQSRTNDKLASLYTENALFFGSTPDLFRGRAGVRAYFSDLRADIALDGFDEPEVIRAGPDTILTAGFWRFRFGGEPRRYRLAWTIVRAGDGWLIAAHNAAPAD